MKAPAHAADARERLLEAFELALYKDEAGSITRQANSLKFRKGYRLLPYSANRFALFDPGEITVGTDQDLLEVGYRLGLTPFYLPLLLVLASLVFIVYLEWGRDLGLILIVAASICTMLVNVWIKFRSVRAWLKLCADKVLNGP